jgi:thiol-disulfide isomerase/thioredoxin
MKPSDTGTGEAHPHPWGHRLILLGLILALFVLLHQWRAQPLASGPAPPLAGSLIAGGHFDLAEARDGPLLVHFWATWCPVCRLGDQEIDAIARDFPVVTVALQSGSRGDIAAYMKGEGLEFPVIADTYGELASAWGVQGVPASFVVDGQGRIRFSTVGYSTETGLRGRLWLAKELD